MGLLFVSHDLGVVKLVIDHIAVVYGGEAIEVGPTADVSGGRSTATPTPCWPRTRVSRRPTRSRDFMGQRFTVIRGSVPSLGEFPAGCRFRTSATSRPTSCGEPRPQRSSTVVTATAAGTPYGRPSMPSLVEVRGMHFRYGKAPKKGRPEAWTLTDISLGIKADRRGGRRRVRFGEVDLSACCADCCTTSRVEVSSKAARSATGSTSRRRSSAVATRSSSRARAARSTRA